MYEAKSATVNFLKKTCEEEDEHDVCQLGVFTWFDHVLCVENK